MHSIPSTVIKYSMARGSLDNKYFNEFISNWVSRAHSGAASNAVISKRIVRLQ